MNGSFTVIWLKSKKSKILSYEFFYSKKGKKKEIIVNYSDCQPRQHVTYNT